MLKTSKKIAVHVSTVHSWEDPRIFRKECRSLVNEGYEVHLITPDGVNAYRDGVYIHKLRQKFSGRLARFTKGAHSIFKQAVALNPDVIHFHDPELIPVALSFKNKGYSIIYDIHEDNLTAIQQREYLNNILRWFFKKLLIYFEQKAYEELTTVIAEKYYQDRFPKAIKVLNYPELTWSEKRKVKNQKVQDVLLYTGNIREDRGALIYAGIVNASDSISLHCIGRCDPELADKMKMLAGNKKDRLIINGVGKYVPFDEIKQAYTTKKWLAGLAVFPKSGHFERKQLTKFFEYMAAGIPIIYSDFPEWKKLLEPLDVGLAVDPENTQDILDKIRLLKSDAELWDRCSRNGIEAARHSFNWKSEEQKLLELYSRLMN